MCRCGRCACAWLFLILRCCTSRSTVVARIITRRRHSSYTYILKVSDSRTYHRQRVHASRTAAKSCVRAGAASRGPRTRPPRYSSRYAWAPLPAHTLRVPSQSPWRYMIASPLRSCSKCMKHRCLNSRVVEGDLELPRRPTGNSGTLAYLGGCAAIQTDLARPASAILLHNDTVKQRPRWTCQSRCVWMGQEKGGWSRVSECETSWSPCSRT